MSRLPALLIRDDTIIAGGRACGVGEGEEAVARDVVEGGIGEIKAKTLPELSEHFSICASL